MFLLTNKQYRRRFTFLAAVTGASLIGLEMQRQYMLNRGDIFLQEYCILMENPNFYHTLHEQVGLGLDVKAIEESEKKM